MTHKKELFIILILFLIGIFSRGLFVEEMQSHWDGPQYTIAVVRYSLVEHTPSPPGYPIYIAIGKMVNFFLNDPHTAIVLVSVLFSGLGAVCAYLLARNFFKLHYYGIIAALLYLSSPVFYYFGITANPYGALFVTNSLLAYIVYKIYVEKKEMGILLGMVFSFAIGFRPQDLFFLFPLFLLGIFFISNSQKLAVFFSLTFFSLLWFIPLINSSGGIIEYFLILKKFGAEGALNTIGFSNERIVLIGITIIKGLYLSLGFSPIFLLLIIRKFKWKCIYEQKKIIIFFIVWIIPAFLFNVFIRTDHAAHQITYLSGLLFLCTWGLYRGINHFQIRNFIVFFIIMINLWTFFRIRDIDMKMPYVSQSYHYSELKKNAIRMKGLIEDISSKFSATDTIIIVDPELFRSTGYYFKNYYVYAFSSLDTTDKRVIDTVHVSYNWNYKLLKNYNHQITIPSSVKHIIWVPNNKIYNFTNFSAKKYVGKGNSLYYYTRANREILKFSLNKIIKI